MKLIISNISGVPIYEQIKQQIKAAILSGELQAEEMLPSLRTCLLYTSVYVPPVCSNIVLAIIENLL